MSKDRLNPYPFAGSGRIVGGKVIHVYTKEIYGNEFVSTLNGHPGIGATAICKALEKAGGNLVERRGRYKVIGGIVTNRVSIRDQTFDGDVGTILVHALHGIKPSKAELKQLQTALGFAESGIQIKRSPRGLVLPNDTIRVVTVFEAKRQH